MPLEQYVTLLAEHIHFGQHAKCCIVSCKQLNISWVARATCCMTPILHTACHMQHATNTFLRNPQNCYKRSLPLQSLRFYEIDQCGVFSLSALPVFV